MVDIDVKRALALNKRSGSLSFEYQAENDLIDIPYVSFSTPVKTELNYEIGEDGKVFVTGSVRFRLKGNCSRCLKETEREYSSEVEAVFVEDGDDGEDYAYTNGRVKLDEAMRDFVSFALPNSFLCLDGCEMPAFH